MDAVRQDLSPILATFSRERQYLLPALQRVQHELGSLPLWALETVGQYLRVPNSDVYGVATHSPELRLDPPPTHRIRVCTGLSCYVLGAASILSTLHGSMRLGAGHDDTVEIEEISCGFICGVAPVVEVDGIAHGRVTPESATLLASSVIST